MPTLYAIHTHSTVWAHDSNGNPMTSTDRVIEFVPESGCASYWYMSECVGSFEAVCTACGTSELGDVTETGTLDSKDAVTEFVKLHMGERWDYNESTAFECLARCASRFRQLTDETPTGVDTA